MKKRTSILQSGENASSQNQESKLSGRRKKNLYDLIRPESDPDAFYEIIRERFAIYKSLTVHTGGEVTNGLLWRLFLFPERDASCIHEHANEMTFFFRRTMDSGHH